MFYAIEKQKDGSLYVCRFRSKISRFNWIRDYKNYNGTAWERYEIAANNEKAKKAKALAKKGQLFPVKVSK